MTRSHLLQVGVGVLAVVMGGLAIAQLVLPGLAARRLRDQLARDGSVRSVTVRAFPAIKLLWGRADSVVVHFTDVVASRARTGDLLARAGHTGGLLVSADAVAEGPLRLRDVTVRKHGGELDGQAAVTDADLRAALPSGFTVQPVATSRGALLLRARGSLFGLGFGVDALLSAQDGALVIAPTGVPFAGLVTFTVFSDPHVSVQSVGAAPRSGGFTVTVVGRLRDA